MTKWSPADRKPRNKKGKMTDEELKDHLAEGLAVLAKDWRKPEGKR